MSAPIPLASGDAGQGSPPSRKASAGPHPHQAAPGGRQLSRNRAAILLLSISDSRDLFSSPVLLRGTCSIRSAAKSKGGGGDSGSRTGIQPAGSPPSVSAAAVVRACNIPASNTTLGLSWYRRAVAEASSSGSER